MITLRNKTCSMKNLVYCMIKINQPIRCTSKIPKRNDDYQMVYKFPLIRIASIVNRLKLYQTVATGIGIPVTSALAALDILPTATIITFTLSGLTWCLASYIIGFFGHNRVGFIYLKNDQKSVKIASTDFWGGRVDTIVDINDIWPLSDLPSSAINPFYYNLRRYSTNKSLKFNIKYGIIVDPEKFRLIFGDHISTVRQ